ncbi:hypothetical protein J3R30DRAFT_556432 [Lentinula aciculospora]|uniref:Shugoshin C-terminal domain-containing protein n=1 Tax=Lentinula aciculospora TaxID=153920 RepID=A0A9W9DLL0_9AGAR|nr:hypothetical protein J3R30DRAFT_556432 [Lentinula aciculospora]
MSRRDSRVSMNARQNDALFEFENFKKKFLLANKHITKLNSTLSVRIEELNAQISTLYTENLRLRASEINLAAQLKREREKSRKVIAETEAAVRDRICTSIYLSISSIRSAQALGLTKHMGFLRQAFSIPEEAPSSSSSPTPPRATQRTLPSADSPNSPVYPRLCRAPTIPLIYEDDEPSDPTEDEDEVNEKTPSPRRKTKAKRLSASRLPLPSRVSSPPIPSIVVHQEISMSNSTKRKPLRRQSGLLVRQGSPVVGSHEAEEEDEAAAFEEPLDEELPVIKKPKRKTSKDKGKEREHEISLRKKLRDEMGDEGKKLKLADVTNSPRSQASQPVDAGLSEFSSYPTYSESSTVVVSEVELEVARTSTSRREFLSSSPPRSSSSSRSSPGNYLPTPQQSSTPLQISTLNVNPNSEAELAPVGGRERRVRRSVNYAEPKLNTKMRKPDSETTGNSSRKRRSASADMSTRSEERVLGHEADTNGNFDDADGGARSSLEGPEGQISRPRSRVTDAAQLPLPASRPGSSADMAAQPLASTTSAMSRRGKSRSYLCTAEDDLSSESDEADTEYIPSSGPGRGGSSWVNMSERKKGGRRVTEDDAVRRHSSAV